MEDREIIDLYFRRSESAITETAKKYGKYCHYIANNILDNISDADEVVNDTYLKTWNTVPPQKPIPLKPYVGMISRQLAINFHHKKHTERRGGKLSEVISELDECIQAKGVEQVDMTDRIALREALGKFVASLTEQNKRVFVLRYWYMEPISKISKKCGLNESTVKVILLRTRERLKSFLASENIGL